MNASQDAHARGASRAVDRSLFAALGDATDELRRPPLVYLDSATTALMPQPVVDVVTTMLTQGGSPGRSVHALGQRATASYEQARADVAKQIGGRPNEVVFVRSATEGFNFVAEGWARPRVSVGDEICISTAEHHSNVLPWRRLCQRSGARLVVVGCDAQGDVDLDDLQRKLGPKTKLVALTHVSNVTGAVTPVERVATLLAASPAAGAPLVVDGAQAVAHFPVDVSRLGCDYYVFSGHKVYGPPGVGVVWARPKRWQETEPPWVGGGMVTQVRPDRVEYMEGPGRFEAGTPNMAGAVGLAAALAFVAEHRDPGWSHTLLEHIEAMLDALDGVRVLGRPRRRVGAISFVIDGVHAHDAGSILDGHGVALRAGHHCAQPLLRHFGVTNALRASLGLYNTIEDVHRLAAGIEDVRRVFGRGEGAP